MLLNKALNTLVLTNLFKRNAMFIQCKEKEMGTIKFATCSNHTTAFI